MLAMASYRIGDAAAALGVSVDTLTPRAAAASPIL